jgi:polyhydroxyalkanoate synthase
MTESAASDIDVIASAKTDYRFRDLAWRQPPFRQIAQSFLLTDDWWRQTTEDLPGIAEANRRLMAFAIRQVLDAVAPSNVPWLNPEVIRAAVETGGWNFPDGWMNFLTDFEEMTTGRPTERSAPKLGRDIATTPGKVVFRNGLIELIQYAPATETVAAEPILIVPAWIMKYYILDLSPQNSLVRFLTERGFTVFMISWKNPGPEDRDLRLDDYRTLGVMDALDAVADIVPDQKVHAVGYCLGGTLLSIAAATMGRDGDDRLKSITLLAAQTDFTEAGELTLFINESQLTFLEDMMWAQGFLDAKQMAGAFQMLRSNDLIWSRVVHEYLMGERSPMIDLMAWNADSTRMPYRMHSEYLRQLFLNNDLAEGRFMVGGRPIALTDIRAPVFAVGTVRDHVAPWRSTYKIHLLTDTDVTYLLTTGGHNAGIVSEPGHDHSSFQVMTKTDDRYIDPERYLKEAPRKNGSWWPEWAAWLAKKSDAPVVPPPMGVAAAGHAPLCDAPGTYVLQG